MEKSSERNKKIVNHHSSALSQVQANAENKIHIKIGGKKALKLYLRMLCLST